MTTSRLLDLLRRSRVFLQVGIVLLLLATVTPPGRGRWRRDQRGSLSVEQVVVTGVLLLLAIAVAGAIKLAVTGRLADIN